MSFFMLSSVGCTIASSNAHKNNDENITVPISPNARLYSYFILVGAARGEIMVGHLKKRDIPLLLSVDREARNVILNNMRFPSSKTDYEADQKLIAYLLMIRKYS